MLTLSVAATLLISVLGAQESRLIRGSSPLVRVRPLVVDF